ncbi:MAG: lytic transglycosylase F [Lewinellaceae bacterium]|nr:lytic transglycosylase F [Lewinellaceae bacterium]
MSAQNPNGRPLLLMLLLLGLACQPSGQDGRPTDIPETADSLSANPFHPLDEVLGLSEQWQGNLDGMVARRRIRALVPYSRDSYYIDGAERRGLAYEAMNLFEKYLNDKLGENRHVRIVFIPTTRDRLIPALLEGYGDIVVANLTVTPQRLEKVAFSEPVLSGAREVVVTPKGVPPLTRLQELQGKTVQVRASSSFYEHLQSINDSLRLAGSPEIGVELVDEHLEDEDILEMVNAGLTPMAIMDEHRASFWAQTLDSLQVHHGLAIFSGGDIAWAMRKDNPELKASVDEFIRKNRKGTLIGNMLFNRYLKKTDYVRNAFSKEDRARFKATRDYFIKYGHMYDLDWLLLAAQGYQESRLNPNLVSPAGAVGIMQIKPSTASGPNIGIKDVRSLEGNIHAGAKYLRFLIDKYFVQPDIDSLNAGLFAVAAYNAGPQRILRLQEEAADTGLDATVWFDNVELLAARDIGGETVQYVSNIYKYYTSYRSLARYMELTGKSPFEDW